MARTVVAVFESVYTAKKAFWELTRLGFPRERIDLVTDQSPEYLHDLARPEKIRSELVVDELRVGADIGAGIGVAMGITVGLLISLRTMRMPPSIATPLAVVILVLAVIALFAAAGSLAGLLMSGLVGLGIPEEEIRQYAKNVHKGNVTLTIVADWDAVDGTLEVLGHHNPLEIQQMPIKSFKAGLRENKITEPRRKPKASEQDRPR